MANTTRRAFLKQTTAIGLTGLLPGRPMLLAAAASNTVHLACVGVGGKGWSDMQETSAGHHVVAICDTDETNLAKAATAFPQACKYTDWRKLLEQTDIDAVTISTPDHTHAPVTMAAMSLGKHVYTQKPLTHDVVEARRLAEAAIRYGVVTQMGIQGHASGRLKNGVQLVRDGVIGKVREVHAWTDRPGDFWQQGLERPARTDMVPDALHWNLWLGTAPSRPYVQGLYHPFHWRGWWDFGTGALGDMGCHLMDPVFTALELQSPTSVRADGPAPNADSGPLWCQVAYEFPATRFTSGPLRLVWYEAGRQPTRELIKAPQDWPGSKSGVLFVGERGNVFVGFPEPVQLFPAGDFADTPMPQHKDHNHYTQWTDAIVGRGKTACPFSYSGPLTESVLLGNVAYRSGQTLHWDAKQLAIPNAPSAERFLKRSYRPGWEVEGL
jgi:predicted dehydrogenase